MVGTYSANIIQKTREYTQEEWRMIDKMREEANIDSTVTMERLLWMDDTFVPGASMYMECIWLWEGETKQGLMEEPHVHAFDEVIGFIGSDPEHPDELDARMEMHMGDEVHYLEKSCLMYLPAGMKHCPLTFKEVRRPVFFFTLAPIGNYGRTSGRKDPKAYEETPFTVPEPDETGTKYARYIITQPKASGGIPGEAPRDSVTKVVTLDGSVFPGAFYTDFFWVTGDLPAGKPRRHGFDEMLGIIGAAGKDAPRHLTGQVSMTLGGDRHEIKESSLVYVHNGLEHTEPALTDVTKPVLCFNIGTATKWETL